MATVCWLHLSDLHLSAQNTFDQRVVLEAFHRDLKAQLEDVGVRLDFIFLTGDVAFNASHEDYQIAAVFLERLCDETGVPKENLFIVPGNHDVNRYKVSKLLDDNRRELRTREEIRAVFENKQTMAKYLERFDNYSKFISSLYSHTYVMDIDNCFTAELRSAGSINFGIIGLNSVWASYGGRHDSNNIYISEVQLEKALEKVNSSSIRIVLAHHPVSWLYEEDKADIENMLFTHCHIILHGHLHRSDFQIVNSIHGSQIIIPAGAIYTGRRISNSYNLTYLDFSKKNIRIMPRRYFDGPRKFMTDIETLANDKIPYFEASIPLEIMSKVEKSINNAT